MKKNILLSLCLAATVISCAGAPTGLEKQLFNVQEVTIPIVVSATNPVTGAVTTTTNYVEGFDFTPSETSEAIVETGTTIGNFFGVGGIVGTLLSAVLGVWAKLRSNSNRKTAAVLAQVIEAGRKIMDKTPQGQEAEKQWVNWMSRHQTETGVVLEVSKLLKQVVNKESAQLVADELIRMTSQAAPKPQPKK